MMKKFRLPLGMWISGNKHSSEIDESLNIIQSGPCVLFMKIWNYIEKGYNSEKLTKSEIITHNLKNYFRTKAWMDEAM